MSDIKPDWENFAKAVLTDWPTGDMDGSVLFDLSLQYGMIQEVPGGYNSDVHIDADGICPEEGDPWYVYTFRGEAGPGLYSILGINNYIEDREKACVEWAEVSQSNYQRAKAAEAKLAQAVERLEAWVKLADHCSIEDGVCCCGEDMEGHSNPMNCGHSPVDHGAYIARQLEESTRATLATLKGDKP
jgi:hypothetical protein